jgi:hypothetical protein
MRMMLQASFPVETFNAAVRDGSAGAKMKKILEVAQASDIPKVAEPWFLLFNAKVKLHPVMTPQDLASSGLDALGKEWG